MKKPGGGNIRPMPTQVADLPSKSMMPWWAERVSGMLGNKSLSEFGENRKKREIENSMRDGRNGLQYKMVKMNWKYFMC